MRQTILQACTAVCLIGVSVLMYAVLISWYINEPWSSLDEVASYLGVNKDTIRNWIKKTDIPAHKIGRQWKFKLSEVDAWIKSGKSAM